MMGSKAAVAEIRARGTIRIKVGNIAEATWSNYP
jgi:hypothetical protein